MYVFAACCASELEALREEVVGGSTLSKDRHGDPDAWRRPSLPLRDHTGHELQPGAAPAPRESVYTKRLHEFAVSTFPSYRRLSTMHASEVISDEGVGSKTREKVGAIVGGLDADTWEYKFGEDVRRLATEILIHVCGDSCFKYSGSKTTQICRHGFYYVVVLEDWRRRRRGKPLRNALVVVRQSKFGMQGRILHFQEHPFECQSNYAALGALRCNFDMQDLRRVFPEENWLEEELPHLGDRPDYGYMNKYEWDGDNWLPRREEVAGELPQEPLRWTSDGCVED